MIDRQAKFKRRRWLCFFVLALAGRLAASNAEIVSEHGNVVKACQWQCAQWQRVCDIDPRGIRRCQRRCTKLEQICA